MYSVTSLVRSHSPTALTETDDPVVDAHRVLRWAHRRFGDELVVTASFGDATLVHLVASG